MTNILKNSFFAPFLSFLLFAPLNTHAYLDPGTGSYIIQVLIASAVSVLFLTKIYWRKVTFVISNAFKKVSRRQNNDENKQDS